MLFRVSKTTIWDRDFIKNKYFFLDLSYREQFEKGYRGNQAFIYEAGTDIVQLDVYKSTSLSDGQGRSAIVVLDPLGDYGNVAPDTIETVDGQSDKGLDGAGGLALHHLEEAPLQPAL